MADMKYLIAIPCVNNMPTPTVAALTHMNRVGLSRVTFLQNSMVYDARHKLMAEALETGADRVLFIDSDMVFNSHMMERLVEDMDAGRDMVSGLYFRRIFPTNPVLYKTLECQDEKDVSVVYTDYPKDTVFEVAACGFGAVMLSRRLIKDVSEAFKYPFAPWAGIWGEDISFCWRVRELGYKIWCDSRIKVGHVGHFVFSEDTYIAQKEMQKGGIE